MHSRIFQISTMQIGKENYLNEDTLQQGDGSYYDYCAEISEEARKQDIRYLVNTALPKGMFELVDDDTMRYIGGAEQWKEDFVINIRKKAEAITVENMLDFIGPVYQLEKALENPLDIAYHFYLDGEGYQSFAEKSFAFMEFVCSLEPGTTLYIGGVIDYHFDTTREYKTATCHQKRVVFYCPLTRVPPTFITMLYRVPTGFIRAAHLF